MSGTPIRNDIRRLRFEHGQMTQEALAQACSVTRQTIIALEANRYAPSLELAFRIARIFDGRVDDVFRWGDDDAGAAVSHDVSGDPAAARLR